MTQKVASEKMGVPEWLGVSLEIKTKGEAVWFTRAEPGIQPMRIRKLPD